ncbi:kynurenine 3-monooxygenase [Aspergillus clavatus NRRL 1]|uniref:Kynurenine 3-monooxygenase n=1 Tax=Aspergillus clavatus (strain ATCC 1007 / CBS 513.65 / DSM 816 / NCTC 3887 / NRRL 1 / QM 1276 / 107) TaxID=344612 RepID=KMO_ASPCL|nr:kynurenine 3-monooxygenase, putative [Aspergillus clavatus NRRL 1]A1CT23.1 RecName: Full=Kynurenine 3-monooxygenase; AltName: Full=Biosynthesis of nicotinic acid protein 4; AltName: Full=Kynurenine 3-hydroxylase [Aspergillus clavatus NRRL 1]EAW06460.1 kynurenine 3-monooxygenase, putative [Aspergillus clavatus NRRL 1]
MADTVRKPQKVVIVGAGPVGSLAALYAAARGDEVEVYELRGDLRDPSTIPLNFTKSINLALSERGINAMKHSNREELTKNVLRDTIPMYGRMIHGKDRGQLWEAAQAYDVHGRAINAVDRSTLNNALLDELEHTPNVKLFFNHKLTGADFRANKAWFERRVPGEAPLPNSANRVPEIEVDFDFMLGADGAHSAVRYHMMKFARVDYQQEYIDTLWCEFRIAPTENGEFRISPNHLHIWPGREFMFIALPSADKSFTCTLFAPAVHYTYLASSPQKLLDFFDVHFPGVSPELIPPADLQEQFATNPHLPLISLKCKPHHFGSSVAIVGDAAHAVLPFYGQGLNAGLEDIRVLFEVLDKHSVYDLDASHEARREAREKAFQAYTDQRCADTHAINDLSKENYVEMRWGVKTPLYKLRKSIEEILDRYVPSLGWQTQYSRVSFSNQRYSDVIKLARRQGTVLGLGLGSTFITAVGVAGYMMWKNPKQYSPLCFMRYCLRHVSHIWVKFFRNTAYA